MSTSQHTERSLAAVQGSACIDAVQTPDWQHLHLPESLCISSANGAFLGQLLWSSHPSLRVALSERTKNMLSAHAATNCFSNLSGKQGKASSYVSLPNSSIMSATRTIPCQQVYPYPLSYSFLQYSLKCLHV